MAPLPPDRLNELRDVAKALAGERRGVRSVDAQRRPARALASAIVIVAAAVALVWHFATTARRATEPPATIAVAQAPLSPDEIADDVVHEPVPRAEPVARVEPNADVAPVPHIDRVPEPEPTVNLVLERPAPNEIGALLAAERGIENVRPKIPAARRPPPRQRVSATPRPSRAAPIVAAKPKPPQPAPVIAAEPEPPPRAAVDRTKADRRQVAAIDEAKPEAPLAAGIDETEPASRHAAAVDETRPEPPPVPPADESEPEPAHAAAADDTEHEAAEASRVVTAEPEAPAAPVDEAERTVSETTARRTSPEAAAGVASDRHQSPNLSGRWLLTNAIDTTTHSSFAGLRIRFRVQLEQHGESLSGRGEKYTVDDEPLPRSQRSPIVLEGTVRGRDVLVRFLERGTRRVSSGGFRWRISPDGKSLDGTFDSTAAGTRGRSHATRDG